MSTSTSTSTDTQAPGPVCDLTADDMFESLNGFDELAITATFKHPITVLAKTDEMQFVRALVFIDQRRRDLKDREAYKAAQDLTMAALTAYFADDEEVDDEDPVTDQGKRVSG